jgi:hypothetical protein
MSIDGVSGKTSYIGTTIINMRSQLNDLTTQLATGKISTSYAGQGTDRGFTLNLRAQVASFDAFADTANNVNTRLNVANLALQGLADAGTQVKKASTTATIVLNNNGQTTGQITAQAMFSNAVSLLNSQSSDRFLFSGRATDKAATVPADVMLNGTATQAGLTQLINERRQADQGTGTMGRLTVSSPPLTTTVTSVAEDGSAFGLKLLSVQSSLTGATVTQPAGTPPATTVDLGAVNPKEGDKIKFNFALPDGTTESIELTATATNPPPTGSFLIDTVTNSTNVTTANLQSALTAAIQKLSDTALVAASAIAASDNFFNPSATIAGSATANKVAAPITGATLRGNGFAHRRFRGKRHHHRQRHHDHLRSLGRDWQPGQHHRQRPDAAREDRFDHGHYESIDRQQRCDHAAWRQRHRFVDHQLEHGRVRSTRLPANGDGEQGAAAGRRTAVRHGGNAGGGHAGQYRVLVHR